MAKPIYSDMVFQTENSFCFLPSCTDANKMLLLFINIFIEETKYIFTYCNLIVLF